MDKQEIKDQIIDIIREASPNYITADEIYTQLTERIDPGRTQETIRKTIRELINDDNNLIGSSNRGYFIIDEEEKLVAAEKYLTNRIERLQKRANNLRKLWNERPENNE